MWDLVSAFVPRRCDSRTFRYTRTVERLRKPRLAAVVLGDGLARHDWCCGLFYDKTSQLGDWVPVQSFGGDENDELSTLFVDGHRFLLQNGPAIKRDPREVYQSALAFTPRDSLLKANTNVSPSTLGPD